MKKLWIIALAMLIACASALGASAEALAPKADWEVVAQPVEVEYPEEALVMGEAPLDEADLNGFVEQPPTAEGEDGGESVVEEPPMAGPNNVFGISNGVLSSYTGNTSTVVIPNTVTSIQEGTFIGHSEITSLTIPTSVTSIGPRVFMDCSGLTELTIPDSVTTLGEGNFQRCTGLKKVTLPKGIKEIGEWMFSDCAALATINIPEGVTFIGEGAFTACEALKTLTLPSTLKRIDENAFWNSGLTQIAIPDGVTSMGKSVFSGCFDLLSAKLPAGLTTISDELFIYCNALKEVNIPSGVTAIGERAFEKCFDLPSVALPDGLTSIGEGAFLFCTSLKDVVIPSGVTAIDSNTFMNCHKLGTIFIPASVTSIADSALAVADEAGMPIQNYLDVVIRTTCNSAAQKFAKKNGFKYEAAGHTLVTDAAVAATCTAEGKTEGSHCSVCGDVIAAQTPVPATGHTPVTDAAVAATCTAEGKTEGSHCSVCNAVLVAQTPIPATGHTPVVDPYVAPAYGVEGRTEGSHCAVCGAVLVAQQPIPALTYQEFALSKVKSNGIVVMTVGEQLQIEPAFATASGWTVNGYKSSKPAVASIDGNGLLTANAEGSTKITVTTNEKKKATITVKVIDPYKPTAIAIAQGKAITIEMGHPLQLNATLAPESARATLTWTSSKGKVATVDGNGLVTPVGEGKTKITVKTQNKKKATITVQVVDPNKPLGIAIAQGKSVTMKMGETLQLTASLNPATAQSALTWKTNKPNIASVDANGLVTAVKKGKAKITVTTYNKKKATITVNVVE